jgi:hypothetical protein
MEKMTKIEVYCYNCKHYQENSKKCYNSELTKPNWETEWNLADPKIQNKENDCIGHKEKDDKIDIVSKVLLSAMAIIFIIVIIKMVTGK